MAQNTGRTKRSEKGLLTPDNCVVAIIDLQPQMLFGVANFDNRDSCDHRFHHGKSNAVTDRDRG